MEENEECYCSGRNVENLQKTAEDIESLTGLFCERVAVCDEG